MNAFILIAISIILFDFVENKKLQKSFEEIFGDGWHLKGMGEEGEEKEEEPNLGEEKEEEANLAQIMAPENEQQKRSGEGQSNHQMINESDQNEEEETEDNDQQQKTEIIRKFRAIKEKIKQKKGKKYSGKERYKIERTIAKKLGTNRFYIYKWIRELGMSQRKMQTNEGKMAIMRQYWEMKRNDPKMRDVEIAKEMKVGERSMRRWKCQFKELRMEIKKQFCVPDEQKREIVRTFQSIKEKMKGQVEKCSGKQWRKIEKLLAKKLGTNRDYVYKWRRELGMGQKRTNEERIALMRKYWEMKRSDSKMSDEKIAKALNISIRTMQKWKGPANSNTRTIKQQI